MIKITVISCNVCGWQVTHDQIGMRAMASHWELSHKDQKFQWWDSMRTEEIII